jgi:hypothetical protein
VPVIAAPSGLAASLATPRNAAIAGVLGLLAAALAVSSLSNDDFAKEVGDGVTQGVNGIKSVAAMLNGRSPGERAQGALANLKQKRHSAVHERALAKVRRPGPLANLVGTPLISPVMPPPASPTPLYNLVAGGPPMIVPPAAIVPGGPPNGGGPPIFTAISPPGGGGGGVIVPPPVLTSTPVVPEVPVTSAVPEPTTWAMMLVGFALIGGALQRRRRTAAPVAAR